ncbi:MAG: ABC transporter ATP-binding protein [Propionibacteriaceae bacterium]|nr:ABC transporter ATP-binding protein [Propionibacteriaceae bacterium]
MADQSRMSAYGPQRIDPADKAQLAESPVRWQRIARLFAPQRWRLLLLLGIIVVISAVGMGQPFLLRAVIDDALPNRDTHLLVVLVAAMIGIAVVTAIGGVWQTWLASAIGERVMHNLRVDVFANIQRQSIDFFKRTRAGEIQSRLVNDVAGLQSVLTTTATSVASNLTTAVATAIAMVALDWRLSLISLIILPPAIWGTRKVALVRRDLTRARQQAMSRLHNEVDESLSVSGALLSKTLGIADRRTESFSAVSATLIDLDMRSQLAGRWRMATMSIIFAALPAIIYLAAGFGPVDGRLTIGTVVAFTALQSQIFRPIMGLLNIGAQWVASMALLSRIFQYLDLVPQVAAPADPVRVDPDRLRGEIRYEHVSYVYPDADRPALDDIDLTIPAGSSVGLAGSTGSGKSTAASLLSRLADPTEGRITIDGIDLRDFDPTTLASIVGVVTQETYLVHDSLRGNLLLAKPEATQAELWGALEAARIADVVRSLPDGLDTVVGARGHRFSGGERQRIAVARTLLRNPRVLILDEATSALDTNTEHELQAALDHLATGRTTLTIAHRLSTIRDADQIVVLDHGRIVERGTHAELLALGGRYAELDGGYAVGVNAA